MIDNAPVIDAEKIVLGTLMTDPIVVEKVASRLTAERFYNPRHGIIYRHLLAAHAAGDPVDPVALAHRLDAAGDLARVGAGPYLHELVAAVPLSVQVDYHLATVLEAADRRAVAEQAVRLGQAADITDRDRRRQVVADIAETLVGRAADDTERDSWKPIDLGPYLRGEIKRPEPTVGVARRDGVKFIYPGKEHTVIGEMESGKSWLVLASAAAELIDGKTVVYIHFEEPDPLDTLERLEALGVPERVIEQRFWFVGPDKPATDARVAWLADLKPSLTILDGINEGMSLHGAAIREEDGVSVFRRRLVTPFIRGGAAVLGCDHVVKDQERRGRGPLGSVHKGNALSGTLILLENAEPFGRDARGRSRVYITKDRPGYLRRHGRPTKTPGKTYMGELVVDDTRAHVRYLDLAICPPPDDQATTTGATDIEVSDEERVMNTVTDIVQKGKVPSLRMVRGAAGLGKDKVDNSLARLVLAGSLTETPGPRNSRIFTPTTVAQDPIFSSVPSAS